MHIQRNDDRQQELFHFLQHTTTGVLATAQSGAASSANVFFALLNNTLIFKSRTQSEHSLNLASNPRAALSIYDHDSNYAAKYGTQLLGQAKRITALTLMKDAVACYAKAFPGADKKLPDTETLCRNDIASTFYQFDIEQFKIVDESSAGNRTMAEYLNVNI